MQKAKSKVQNDRATVNKNAREGRYLKVLFLIFDI